MINNYLSSAGFKIIFKRLPHVEFFSNKILLPSVTTNAVKQDTPLRAFYTVGDHLAYADLDLTFIIDENMKNYREIYDWLKGIGSPDSLDQYDQLKDSALFCGSVDGVASKETGVC